MIRPKSRERAKELQMQMDTFSWERKSIKKNFSLETEAVAGPESSHSNEIKELIGKPDCLTVGETNSEPATVALLPG